MPIINITMGQQTEDQKREIIEKVTQAMVDVTGIPQANFMTMIHELPYENFGIGTQTLKDYLNESKHG